MPTTKQAGNAPVEPLALPKPWEFVPREPVNNESPATVGAEMFRDWVLALKALPEDKEAALSHLQMHALYAARQSAEDGGRSAAAHFTTLLTHMAVSLVRRHANPEWAESRLRDCHYCDDLAAQEKAELVERLAAGRRAAAERRAVAALQSFPRGVGGAGTNDTSGASPQA